MELIKKTLNSLPPEDVPLLVLLDTDNPQGKLFWAIGEWTKEGWIMYEDFFFYTIIEWYKLPERFLNK